MPDLHAVLSPSASERWIQCPASVRMEAQVPSPPESAYATEGTDAHTLAELEGRYAFGKITRGAYLQRLNVWQRRCVTLYKAEGVADMRRYVAMYVDLLRELMKDYPHSQIMFEQRVQTGVPHSWGTSDAVIVSPTHVHIVDFKYGQGVPVSAVENTQTMLYGVGTLEAFGDLLGDTEIVKMTIFQPRLGSQSTYSLVPTELRAWRDDIVLPAAREALGDNGHFGPSPEACRWCAIAGDCKARMEKVTQEDFGTDPDLMTPEEIGAVLTRLPEIRSWCESVANMALDKAYSGGVPIPGWKVVASGGRRGIPDATAAIQTLIDAGYTADQVANFSVKPLGELEKLVGRKELPEILKHLLIKSEGKPSLVPEDDKRGAIQPNTEALKDFGEDLL